MRDLMRTGPAPDLSHLHGGLNRLFGDVWGQGRLGQGLIPSNGNGRLAPAVDAYETPEEFVIAMEIAGVDPATLEISTVAGELTVAGERKATALPEHAKRFIAERRYGSFRRTFAIPTTIDLECVTAKAKDGVLTVRLPKRPEILPTKIDVEVA